MRCPKCSFISFDDLATCAKCSNDLSVIAQELQGTCTDVKPPFFLSSVIQSPEIEDQSLSGFQALPTTDDSELNFDDSIGAEIPFSTEADESLSGFDESLEAPEDDLSIGLGEIMPIDMDQINAPFDLEQDAVFDSTQVITMDDTKEEPSFDDDLDLNLTGDFSEQNAAFEAEEELTFEAEEDLNLSDDSSERNAAFEAEEELTFDAEEDLDLSDVSSERNAAFEAEEELTFEAEEDLNLSDDSSEQDAAFDATEVLPTDVFAEDADLDLSDPFDESLDLGLDEDLESSEFDETRISLQPISKSGNFDSADNDDFDRDKPKADSAAEQLGESSVTDADDDLTDFDFEGVDDELSHDSSNLGEKSEAKQEEVADDLGFKELEAGEQDEDLGQKDLRDEENETKLESDSDSHAFGAGDIADESGQDDTREDLSLNDTVNDEDDLSLSEPDSEKQIANELGLDDILIEDPEIQLESDSDSLDFTTDDITGESGDNDLDEDLLTAEKFATDLDDDFFEPGPSTKSLGLEEIDVSDLISSPEDEALPSADDDELDLASLLEDDEESYDSDLDLLDEGLPEFELLEDDGEDNKG
jgi:hypothetical protein